MGELNLDIIERALPRVEEIAGSRAYGAVAGKKRPRDREQRQIVRPASSGNTIVPACPR